LIDSLRRFSGSGLPLGVGSTVGLGVVWAVGLGVGSTVGLGVVWAVGLGVGSTEGVGVATIVGAGVGWVVGLGVGANVGVGIEPPSEGPNGEAVSLLSQALSATAAIKATPSCTDDFTFITIPEIFHR